MSSLGDRPDGPDDPALGRIFVPEGPMFDAWIAPDGGAVTLSVLAMKMQARWLRRARPRPFGFAPGSTHPARPSASGKPVARKRCPAASRLCSGSVPRYRRCPSATATRLIPWRRQRKSSRTFTATIKTVTSTTTPT